MHINVYAIKQLMENKQERERLADKAYYYARPPFFGMK